MLEKLISGWNRIAGLTGKTILIYADPGRLSIAASLQQIVSELEIGGNRVHVILPDASIFPGFAPKHVVFTSPGEAKKIGRFDAVICLGRPKKFVYEVLSGNPNALFAAAAEI
ncbi:MAG: hypothetical protein N2491_06360 [Negativicutes bacterium]|nr:hypothetical protein [Negativicutes bacterium]